MAIDYAKTFQKYIDEELAAHSATEWMASTSGLVRYGEGKDVEIVNLTTKGLGNYDSSKTDGSAYPAGAVTSEVEPYTLEMDRGIKFALDRCAPQDAAFPDTAETVIRTFAREELVRELDMFRIQRLYAITNFGDDNGPNLFHYDGEEDIVSLISRLQTVLEDESEHIGGYVALISAGLKSKFLECANNTFHKVSFEQQVEINGVTYHNVMMLNDLPCIFVPSGRMKSKLEIRSGRDGDIYGGVVAAADARDLAAILVACDAPLAMSKVDSLKVFGPEENQLFDGTAIQARYLYDLLVPGRGVYTVGSVVID